MISGYEVLLDVPWTPPFLLHVLVGWPVTRLMVLFSLRIAKGALLIAEHRNKAREGKLADKDPEE